MRPLLELSVLNPEQLRLVTSEFVPPELFDRRGKGGVGRGALRKNCVLRGASALTGLEGTTAIHGDG